MQPFEVDWWPKRVVFGPASVEKLAELMAGLGRRRALIVCGRSIAQSDVHQKIRGILGNAHVDTFADIEMHAPLPVLERGAAAARSLRADVVISIGGGSAIDSGKGISLIHTVGPEYLSYALQPGSTPGKARAMPELELAHIAIPTTTGSGSEVAPTCGLRDPSVGHKRIFWNERLIPSIAILDPAVTTGTPAKLTASSGMTAVARSIEALYSGRRNPLRSALALHALRMLRISLPRSIEAPADLDARADCLVASALSAIAANINTSAVHAVGHVVGGRYALQHGVAHAILLAPSMRLMLPIIGHEQTLVLAAMGGESDGLEAHDAGQHAAELMAQFVSTLPLPQRLSDVGVMPSDITDLVEHASHDPILMSAGGITRERIEELFRSVL
jgi:alcohol dehydrogenase class IV